MIRILFYADGKINDDPCGDFSVSELKKLILHNTKCIVDLHVVLMDRHFDYVKQVGCHAATKLTDDLLAQFDELWFFGFKQSNLSAEPENELTPPEVEALRSWMDGHKGGVFIGGDHSNPDARITDVNCRKIHSTFLGLGRALGHLVPRAGQLREWVGPPTTEEDFDDQNTPLEDRDNYNTLEGADLNQLDDQQMSYQSDDLPQHLFLVKAPLPHRLFWYFDERNRLVPILNFPDHKHEGKLRVPQSLDAEWPEHSRRPEVVAMGNDKRFGNRFYPIVVAYDGCNDVGRIVADSSWHHYLNVNLRGFRSRDAAGLPERGSDLDLLAHYYGNLAIWLAPKGLREDIGYDLLERLALHPEVLEVKGASDRALGATALYLLEDVIGSSILYRLFAPSSFECESEDPSALFPLLFLGRTNLHRGAMEASNLLAKMIQPTLLGSIIRRFHDEIDRVGSDAVLRDRSSERSKEIGERITQAFREQLPHAQQRLERLQSAVKALWSL